MTVEVKFRFNRQNYSEWVTSTHFQFWTRPA